MIGSSVLFWSRPQTAARCSDAQSGGRRPALPHLLRHRGNPAGQRCEFPSPLTSDVCFYVLMGAQPPPRTRLCDAPTPFLLLRLYCSSSLPFIWGGLFITSLLSETGALWAEILSERQADGWDGTPPSGHTWSLRTVGSGRGQGGAALFFFFRLLPEQNPTN